MIVMGIDEVGIGPLAGPVIAAAVVFDLSKPLIAGLKDSKKLSEKKRLILTEEIKASAIAYAYGRAEVAEIDTINIYQSGLLAMQRAALQLQHIECVEVLVDGRHAPKLPWKTRAIIKGDVTEPVISAASIIAKVFRDAEMVVLDKLYPQYQFAKHKGYSTKLHLQLLKQYGPTEIHRKSFSPVSELTE